MYNECKHEPFTYRPYRRGMYRCLECGGYLPLSAMGKMWLKEMYDYATRDNFFARFIKPSVKELTIPV